MNNNKSQYLSDEAETKQLCHAVQQAKAILLDNKVQNFQASDVVELAKLFVHLQESKKQ